MTPRTRSTPASRFDRRSLAALAVLATAGLLVQGAQQGAGGASDPGREPILVPHVLEGVRVPLPAAAQVLFYNPDPSERPVQLAALRVRAPQGVLVETPLDRAVVGDPEFGAVNALIERLPAELVDRHGGGERWFAPADAPELGAGEARAAYEEVAVRMQALKQAYAAGSPPPFASLDFELPYDVLFAPGDAPGATREIEIEVDYADPLGRARTARVTRAVTLLAPRQGPSSTLASSAAGGGAGGPVVHAGDLHVHSCHGEAVNACAPSANCGAETLQTSGSFTYAQLKSQYQALGIDWITATDHSYCIDSDGEYASVVAECAALTDGAFVVIPDLELSSEEVGSQSGGDSGDLLCILGGGVGTGHNHMGAHGIDTRKPGGSQGFLGFCGDVLASFTANAAAIRAEKGYPIVNHPSASSFGWNSFAALQGIEANQMHGVEIWNGGTGISGQGGDVGSWVDWLLAGRILYAYAGSDTHDAAFDFGANHVVLTQPLATQPIEVALRSGRVYISQDHSLITQVVYDGLTLEMGTLQSLPPSQPASALSIDTHYNFGADSGTISVWRGRVGDGAETLLCSSGLLTGEGVFSCNDTLDTADRTWYRSYSEAGGKASYGNPIFFLPGTCGNVPYGVGLGGANIGSLTSPTSPGIGTVNRLDLAGFVNSPFGVITISVTKLQPGIPIVGGTLLIGAPSLGDIFLGLSGGAGSFVFQMPFDPTLVGGTLVLQGWTLDGTQPSGFAFSNGLEMTLCDPVQ